MQSTFKTEKEIRHIRGLLLFFIIMLVFSGLTAIPIEWELSMVHRLFDIDSKVGAWLTHVYGAVSEMSSRYPFLFYGYDWLAFAHIVLALVFIGPYRDPVRNKWVIEFGIYACLLIIPFAFIAGYLRGIPFWWRLIDCSFGLIGLIPLVICYRKTVHLESLSTQKHYL